MLASLQMACKMPGHCSAVETDQDAIFSLAPLQNLRIDRTERQIRRVADADNVQRVIAGLIVPEYSAPKQAALVPVQYETERHGQAPAACLVASRRRNSAEFGPHGATARCRSISASHAAT